VLDKERKAEWVIGGEVRNSSLDKMKNKPVVRGEGEKMNAKGTKKEN